MQSKGFVKPQNLWSAVFHRGQNAAFPELFPPSIKERKEKIEPSILLNGGNNSGKCRSTPELREFHARFSL